jgi:hypothetical protein
MRRCFYTTAGGRCNRGADLQSAVSRVCTRKAAAKASRWKVPTVCRLQNRRYSRVQLCATGLRFRCGAFFALQSIRILDDLEDSERVRPRPNNSRSKLQVEL